MTKRAALADQLKTALATYTESGGHGLPTYDTAQAIPGCWRSTASPAI